MITRNEFRRRLGKGYAFCVGFATKETLSEYLRMLALPSWSHGPARIRERLGMEPADLWRSVRKGNIEKVRELLEAKARPGKIVQPGLWSAEGEGERGIAV